jgi:hypothetical protein
MVVACMRMKQRTAHRHLFPELRTQTVITALIEDKLDVSNAGRWLVDLVEVSRNANTASHHEIKPDLRFIAAGDTLVIGATGIRAAFQDAGQRDGIGLISQAAAAASPSTPIGGVDASKFVGVPPKRVSHALGKDWTRGRDVQWASGAHSTQSMLAIVPSAIGLDKRLPHRIWQRFEDAAELTVERRVDTIHRRADAVFTVAGYDGCIAWCASWRHLSGKRGGAEQHEKQQGVLQLTWCV